MPALPAVPNVIRMEIQYSLGTDIDVINRTYWQYTGSAPSNTGLNTMANTVSTNWATVFKPLCASTVQKQAIYLVDLSSSTGAIGAEVGANTGSRSGGQLPAGACALINYTVARRYRGGKPRSYMPFGTDTDLNTPQQWATAFQTTVNSALATWTTDMLASGPAGTTISQQVNVSYYKGFASVQNPVTLRWRNIPTPRATPVVDAILTEGLNLKIGSQRKRYVR